ncbi:glycosyltransferase [Cellulomonas hominis]|nr:glycosyltransferase [Cellulomonas hominis]
MSHSAVVTAWRGRERALRARGHTVHLLSARRWEEGGRPVDLEPEPDEDVLGIRTFGRAPNLFLYDPRPVWRALGRPWDVIDVHEEPCALATAEILLLRALRRVRTPYVLYTAQNIDKRYPVPFRWWERTALRGAAGVSACNAEAVAVLRRKGLAAPARVIGLGVEASGAPSAPPSGAPVGVATPVRVGYVGRFLAPHKGLDVLLDAVAAHPRLRLDLAGAGPHEAALRARADRDPALRGRAAFRGHLAGESLAEFYRSVDVVAVPSVAAPGWLEQFGRVAVEAMAAGVPVVASRSGALPDVVGGAGLLVPPGDPGALGYALLRVQDEPGLAARLRDAGTERARRYTWAAVGEQYEALYRAALEHAAGAGTATARPAALGPPRAAVPDPEVVVVAYGAPELLARALEPLGDLVVTVVDNSGDPRVRVVAAARGARYLDPGANLGFGSAVNRALADRLRPGADVLLLNPDARIDAAGVRRLVRELHAAPDLAAVAPAQVDEAGRPARVLWPFPTPARAWAQALGLGRLADGHVRTGFAIGSVLLLRDAALTQVGGFDEQFFLYSEETDWQRRAYTAGWRSALEPGVRATHTGGATSTDPTRRETHFHASQERYFRKHHGAGGWAVARAAVLVGGAARALLPGDAGAAARLRVRLYARGPLCAEAALSPATPPAPSAVVEAV